MACSVQAGPLLQEANQNVIALEELALRTCMRHWEESSRSVSVYPRVVFRRRRASVTGIMAGSVGLGRGGDVVRSRERGVLQPC